MYIEFGSKLFAREYGPEIAELAHMLPLARNLCGIADAT